MPLLVPARGDDSAVTPQHWLCSWSGPCAHSGHIPYWRRVPTTPSSLVWLDAARDRLGRRRRALWSGARSIGDGASRGNPVRGGRVRRRGGGSPVVAAALAAGEVAGVGRVGRRRGGRTRR